MTTNNRLPGLVGEATDYLLTLPGMDTGLAQGAALSMVAAVATFGGRYFVPAIGIRDDITKLEDLDKGTILFGSETACRVAVNEVDAMLDVAVGDRTWVDSPWAGRISAAGIKTRISIWSRADRPSWFPEPDSNLYCPMLVAATGTERKITRLPPYTRPPDLLIGLRRIAEQEGPTLVRMTPEAAEGFAFVMIDLVKRIDQFGDPGLRLRRWMLLLGVVAIGVDPVNPVATEEMLIATLTLASHDHSLLSWVLERQPNSAVIAH